MAVGDYAQIEKACRRAWRFDQALYAGLKVNREQYLRDLLASLPFRWHVEYAYETAMYGGANHIVVDEPIHIGRLSRAPGDALSRPRIRFWGLSPVEDGRLPSSLADIKIAERLVAKISLKNKRDEKTTVDG